MAQLSSDRPEPTTILAVTAWRDSKYAVTGVVIELAMDNNCIMFEVRFFDAAPKDRMDSNNYRVMNQVDGIDASLSFWIWLKFHQLKHKYKWDKVKKHD